MTLDLLKSICDGEVAPCIKRICVKPWEEEKTETTAFYFTPEYRNNNLNPCGGEIPSQLRNGLHQPGLGGLFLRSCHLHLNQLTGSSSNTTGTSLIMLAKKT